ncbi:hypothetical protein EB093_04915 [bacterium]|nr:hypothetical protein [bacterium]
MTTLPLFDAKGRISSEITQLLLNEGTLGQYPTIHKYAIAHSLTYSAAEVVRLRRLFEESLLEQVTRHAWTMYRLYHATGDWGQGTQFSVQQSFANAVIHLPPGHAYDYSMTAEFDRIAREKCIEFELIDKTAHALRTQFENFRPTLLGKRFEIHNYYHINTILRFVGSQMSIYVQTNGRGVGAIWGHSKSKKIGIYRVKMFTTEVMRTPNFSISNAANVIENEIMTRHESMNAVFSQKWAPLITSPTITDWRIPSNPYWNISRGIRNHTIQLYGPASPSDVERINSELVQEMEESIIFHEIGHTIIREIFLPIENIGIGLGAKFYNCMFYDGIYELLADFAPNHDLGHGAMAHMIKISKTNQKKAERMFYTYLSDVWFFDTDDRFMYDYASICVLCMLRYIQPNKHVDFDLLARDITFSANRSTKPQLSMIERIQELFLWDTDEIGRICKSADYTVADRPMPFQSIYRDRLTHARKTHPTIDPDGYNFLQPFWSNMYNYVATFTSNGEEQKIRKFIDDSVKKNLMKFLVLSCGRTKAEAYQFNHMQYIVDRCFELGLVADPSGSRQII